MSKFFIVFFVVDFFLLLSKPVLVCASRDIPMTKCCQQETFYWQGFDSCRNDSEQSVSWPPIVYSEDLNVIDDITANDFKNNVITSKEDCPNGKIAVSTTKYKFILDGSLRLEDGRSFQVDQFCLSQVFGSEEIVARFCAPDPCIESKSVKAGCIRKCCPNAMALNSTSFSCQPSSYSSYSSFGIQFKNELGESVHRNLSSYVIRDGVTPKCIYGTSPLGKAFDNDEPFYLLPSAQIFIPSYPKDDRMPSDYCIDTNGEDAVINIYFIQY